MGHCSSPCVTGVAPWAWTAVMATVLTMSATVQPRLKSLTGGQGSYSISFSHYAPVPASTQQQLASQFKMVALDDD